MSTQNHRSRDRPTKVLIDKQDIDPFVVIISTIDNGENRGPLHPMTVGKLLYDNNIQGIREVKKGGRYKVNVIFDTADSANTFIENPPPFLKVHKLQATLPFNVMFKQGMALQSNYLHNVMGKVIELHIPYKAIVSFQYRGKQERALLRADKIMINGKNVPMGEPINDYIHEGTMIKFTCHGFDETGLDRCGYFVTMAWPQDPAELSSFGCGLNAVVSSGIYNASGVVSDLSQRQGVVTYLDASDREQNILFLASKLFLFGKRLNTKQNLQLLLAVEDKVQFDAVPCEQSENDSYCSWFATVVWKGKKPGIDYDNPVSLLPRIEEPRNLIAEIKHLVSNPKSEFVRGEGQILNILNEEYGIALAAIKRNSWESVLFHRSACFLFKLNLGSHDLTKIFEEGDRIKFIAARAPKHLITQWVASQITVFISKELELNF